VGERCDQALGEEQASFVEGCPRDWAQLPIPDGPLTVGIDGAFVRAQRGAGWFEVIAGKSVLAFRRQSEEEEESSKCFGFVQTYDTKPKRRLFELLKTQGMQPNQQVIFLSDGGDDVRNLQLFLSPEAEHRLDCPLRAAPAKLDENNRALRTIDQERRGWRNHREVEAVGLSDPERAELSE
jgi:hypothetical protein